MSLEEDYKLLERRYLAARQQIEKLQSNVRILKSSNDDLADRVEALQKDAKEYKKAFDEIFIHHVGASWDNIPPQEREKMGIQEKIEFYKREVSNTQAYMKKSFYEFEGGARKKLADMQEKVEKLEKELAITKEVAGGRQKDTEDRARSHRSNADWMNKGESHPEEKTETKANVGGVKRAANFSFDKMKANKKRFHGEHHDDDDKSKILKNIADAPAQEKKEESAREKTKEQVQESAKENIKENLKEKPQADQKEENPPQNKPPKKTDKSDFDGAARFAKMTEQEQISIAMRVKDLMGVVKGTSLHALYIIGHDGEFIAKDILDSLRTDHPEAGLTGTKAGSFSPIATDLKGKGLIASQKVSSAGKGRPSDSFFLTDLGKWFYWFRFRENPVTNQLFRVTKDQKSVAHGVDIMFLVDKLNNLGYKCTQENSGMTDEGESISDIFATRGNYSYHIEYEEGNYPESGYDQKFRRINKLNRNIVFVTRDKPTAKKIEGFYKNFLADEENAIYRNRPALFLPFSEFQKADSDPLADNR